MRRYFVSGIVATAVAALALGFGLPVRAAMNEDQSGNLQNQPEASQASSTDRQSDVKFSGTVTSVDQSARMITVKGTLMSRSFTLASDASVLIKDKPTAELSDLKAGDKIDVFYTKEGNTLTAHRIQFTGGGRMPSAPGAGTENNP